MGTSKGWEMSSQSPPSSSSLNSAAPTNHTQQQSSRNNPNPLFNRDNDKSDTISLREWLDTPNRSVDRAECLHIFNQIVKSVRAAHGQSVVVTNIRPSCFVMTTFSKISFIESASCSSSDSGESPKKTTNFPSKELLRAEAQWYTSPEEAAGGSGKFASDIYKLGVLLFELFCAFEMHNEKLRTMSNLRHRMLPPRMLIKCADVASFCLWLLHPREESRPNISEVIESELLKEMKDSLKEREASIKIKEETEHQELLLDFLNQLQQRKQESEDRLRDTISLISSDVQEVMNQKLNTRSYTNLVSNGSSSCKKRIRDSTNYLDSTNRVTKNFKKLEAAYFSSRSRTTRGRQMSVNDSFLEGLCSYIAFSKFKTRAEIKQGDLMNTSSLVCALAFNRDQDFFATAGVNRKIKIFEYDTLVDDEHDTHYPVAEMTSKSRFSSVCWNSYIKSQIASSDFEGVVQLWDVTRSQVILEMKEHERRIWSIDYSPTDPTKLASGSDDGTVKFWNINQRGSTGSITTKANVCSVQFPPGSSNLLAVGSADHNVYCYDIRNLKSPTCTLVGHDKTVSYVKFVDSSTLVSASTDSSLKLWDSSVMNSSRVVDRPIETFTGHTNIKNFVGLSVSNGYICTGSETNEVYVYNKAFPMPVLSYKFNCRDPISGREAEDGTQFVSSVCWRGKSSTLVAANSCGNIKILEMT